MGCPLIAQQYGDIATVKEPGWMLRPLIVPPDNHTFMDTTGKDLLEVKYAI